MSISDRRLVVAILLLYSLLGAYVGLYALAMFFIKPAANMAYFIYAGPDWLHDAQYYFFRPINHLHYYLIPRDSDWAISLHCWDRDFERDRYSTDHDEPSD